MATISLAVLAFGRGDAPSSQMMDSLKIVPDFSNLDYMCDVALLEIVAIVMRLVTGTPKPQGVVVDLDPQ